ncbi:hypothetical protein L1887_45958 [Cichorium endivia]|nr:hypothetical protein L1887_45958 [Cichorium endivia]
MGVARLLAGMDREATDDGSLYESRVTASSAQQPDSLDQNGSPRRMADFGTRSLGWRANFSRRHPSRIPPGSSSLSPLCLLHQEPSVQRFITYTALAPFPLTPAQARVSPIMDPPKRWVQAPSARRNGELTMLTLLLVLAATGHVRVELHPEVPQALGACGRALWRGKCQVDGAAAEQVDTKPTRGVYVRCKQASPATARWLRLCCFRDCVLCVRERGREGEANGSGRGR